MNKVDVASGLVDLYGELNRSDRNFEWATFENATVSQDEFNAVSAEAEKLGTLATKMRSVAPDQAAMADQLQRDAQHVAEIAGQLKGMYQVDSPHGSGWGSTLDQSITDVRQAIAILLGNK